MRYFTVLICCFLAVEAAVAQSDQARVPNSLSPGTKYSQTTEKATKRKTHFFSPRKDKVFNFRKARVRHSAQYEFYERVEKAAQEKQRIMRELAKPKYANPKHFGHKKVPKRRSPHKMRYCGECGIRH